MSMPEDEVILIRGARLATAGSRDLVETDLLIEEGKIAQIGENVPCPESATVLEARGRVLLPGMFDVNVHLREPGQEWKENIRSGAAAAINGGVTGLVAMPNTDPAIDNGGMVQSVLEIAERDARIPVLTAGCITEGRAGTQLAAIADMREKGAVAITDDPNSVGNPQLLRRAMEYARDFDLMVASHCDTPELTGAGAMNEGPVSFQLGIPGIPACSEEICLARDIRLAQFTGAHVHIQHVSTERGLETIRRYKSEGVRVTCEVAPHHLMFDEEGIGDYDTDFKMIPPLRTREDNERLLEGLIEGVFDVIATDHAPHAEFEKAQAFTSAPFGITGLETVLPSLYDRFIQKGRFGWDLLVHRYSDAPRRLIGRPTVDFIVGASVDLVLFNPEATTKFTPEFMRSRSSNTPLLNQEVRGRVEYVQLGREVLLNRLTPQRDCP